MTAEAEIELFDCDRHRMRLTVNACAGLWRKGRNLQPNALQVAVKCKGCPIGAVNAGEARETSREVGSADRICCRCQRPTFKLIFGRICVSCRNRELEQEKGRNARGNPPKHLPKLKPFSATTCAAEVQRVELPTVASSAEALLAMSRISQTEVLISWDGKQLLPE